jgi:hypothetical protein
MPTTRRLCDDRGITDYGETTRAANPSTNAPWPLPIAPTAPIPSRSPPSPRILHSKLDQLTNNGSSAKSERGLAWRSLPLRVCDGKVEAQVHPCEANEWRWYRLLLCEQPLSDCVHGPGSAVPRGASRAVACAPRRRCVASAKRAAAMHRKPTPRNDLISLVTNVDGTWSARSGCA